MREQYDQSRKKVSRNCLLLGALEVVLGVLVYFEIASFRPCPSPTPAFRRLWGLPPSTMGRICSTGAARSGSRPVMRSSGADGEAGSAEKFCSHPILSLAVLAGLIAAEWVIWKTAHVAITLLAAGVLTLLFLPLFRQMRRL